MRSLLLFLISLAARLAPPARRATFQKEWRGEVMHALDHVGEGDVNRLRLLLRTTWCLTDALWLRLGVLRGLEPGSALRIAFRRLRRSPGFTVPVVLTLGLGIGACASIYSVAHAVLLRPLPFPEPERLAAVWAEAPATGATRLPVDAPDAELVRERASAFEGVAFVRTSTDATLTGTADAEAIALGRVTGNLFELLGVEASLGRTLRPGDGRLTPEQAARDDDDLSPLPPTVIVLSHAFWVRRFGADPEVLGRTVRIDGNPAVVVGVMPPEFQVPVPDGAGLPAHLDAWTPVRFDLGLFRRTGRLEDQDSENAGVVLARRTRGASPADVADALERVSAVVRRRSAPREAAGYRLVAEPLRSEVGRSARPLLLALLGAAGVSLLIGCLNVAGLLLARSLERERDRAVRAALGAGRGRLIAESLLEGVVLAGTGGVAGVALAVLVTPWLVRLLPTELPPIASLGVSLPVLVFAVGLTALTVILFGVGPAVRSGRVEGKTALATRAGIHGGSVARPRRLLVAGQLALVTVLVVGSGLLAGTIRNLEGVDPGFHPEGVLAFELDLVFRDGYRGPADRSRFLRRLRARLSALPGVVGVGATGALPLSGHRFVQPYTLPGGRPLGAEPGREADFRVVTPGYFEAMGTELLAGRAFTAADDDQDRRVAVVDEKLASELTRGTGRKAVSAVGRFLRIPVDGEEVRAEVVGVVENVRHEALRRAGRPAVYVPYRHEASRRVGVLVRARGEGGGVSPAAIRSVVTELDPRLAVHGLRRMEDLVTHALAPGRFLLAVVAAFGVLSLVLSAIGVFGIVAYDVRARRREMGVRAALGATRAGLVGGTVARSLAMGSAGVAVGVLASLGVGRLGEAVLYGVQPADPRVSGLAAAVVLATTLVAAWIPATRASRVDPMRVLRVE